MYPFPDQRRAALSELSALPGLVTVPVCNHVLHRVLGVLHRVLGALHRVLGVLHGVLGVLGPLDGMS